MKSEIEADGFITPKRYLKVGGTKPAEKGVERYYNLKEASTLLGIKIRTAREWVHSGKMKAVRYAGGRSWYVPESEIRRIQNGNDSK